MKAHVFLIRFLALGLFAGLVFAVAAAEDEPAKKLQGTWQTSMGDPKNKMYEFTITDNKISSKNLKDGKMMGEGTYKLDAAKMTIDVVGTGGEYKGKTYRGLFSIDGKNIKWCTGNANQPRPKKLAHEPGCGSFLLLLQP